MHIVIIANGAISPIEIVKQQISTESIIFAVDGGFNTCITHDIQPDVLVGDFDSIEKDNLDSVDLTHVDVIKYSTEKDETDLELAINHALSLNPSQIDVFGALGDRIDMTISNILFLSNITGNNPSLKIWHEGVILIPLLPNVMHKYSTNPGANISLIPITREVKGITTQGLKYALVNESLYAAQTRGISNVCDTNQIEITLSDGILLLIISNEAYRRENGGQIEN